MHQIIQIANTSPQRSRKQKLYNGVWKFGYLVILNALRDIVDIQGKEQWKMIIHVILRIGIIRALNERAGRLFKAVRKTAWIRNRYNQVPHLSQDTKWESNKITITITNNSQEVSPFPSGDHKAATNRRESMINTRHK